MDLLGFLATFETCPFWVLIIIIALFVDTKISLESDHCFFFFGWVGNKLIKEFSLLCFSFKNQDCVYGPLIKI